MKIYTFEVIIEEGSDEFWESIQNVSGVEEVKQEVKTALAHAGFMAGYGCDVNLVKFEETK